MKKWIVPALSLLLIMVLISISGLIGKPQPVADQPKLIPAIFGTTEEGDEKKSEDSQKVALFKKIQEILDGWLKSINERIESQDITRLEVRFLEFLRSILEWIKAKVDAEIPSSDRQKQAWVNGAALVVAPRGRSRLSTNG